MNSETKEPKTYETGDLVLKEIWRIKDELSASYGHDVHRLFEETRKREKLSGHPIANLQVKRRKVS
jgi:hypothetical protein